MTQPNTTYVPPQPKSWQARWFHFALWAVILTTLLMFLRAVEPILLPFVLGMMVAYLMDPVVGRIQRLRLSRSAAAAIVTVTLFSLIVGVAVWVVPVIYEQVASLLSKAPHHLQMIENNLHDKLAPLLKSLNGLTGGNEPDAIPQDVGVIVERGLQGAGSIAGSIFSSGAALVNLAALLLITPIVCFYLIRDWPSVVARANELLPLSYAEDIREQLYLINRTLSAYVRGQLVVMLIMSVYYIVAMAMAGLHYSLVLGLLAGCIIVVPYVGSILSVSIGLIVANSQFGVESGFWIIVGIYGLGQILESQILTPKIIGDRVGLHPLWMLFGMLAGAVLLGFVGVLLAVPLTAVIGVLVKYAVKRYLSSSLYKA